MPERIIAYFSMEIALDNDIPTYSGGLGVLAGDTIKSAADLRVPVVAVSLLYRKGYFKQKIDQQGWQHESPVQWQPERYLDELKPQATVKIEGRTVHFKAWRYLVKGVNGFKVPVYLLDTDLPENSEYDRGLTDYLYGGDQRYRLCQEVLLGIGGYRILSKIGHNSLRRFHMNEGHASLLTLELLDDHLAKKYKKLPEKDDVEAIRRKCVFTTHTPVAAGHDKFPIKLAKSVLDWHASYDALGGLFADELNMTELALSLSHYVNGVAKKHGEVTSEMFSSYVIDSITNGVHAERWTSEAFQNLFDRHITGWREDNFSLRYALSLPRAEVWEAHNRNKRRLIEKVNEDLGVKLDPEAFTIGFARRAAPYKRADLLFHDIDRLEKIADTAGAFQIIYAGKAHPRDNGGKRLIQRIHQASDKLKDKIKVVYLEEYNVALAMYLVSGVDIWLNTPEPPLEASGTSGMKAALNGVPSLSILDGWWLEGCLEGITGWGIGEYGRHGIARPERSKDAESLYEKLEKVVLPMYYSDRDKFITMMLNCIAINGSFFNTQRMVDEYVVKAYFR